jgi:hypothetical protein
MQTFGQATGSYGKLGYAFASGVEGSYGGFSPQVITQTGLLAGDVTSANVKANTWLVSGNYLLRNSLGKLRYQFTPNTALTLGAYVATSWDDKTGEGDNDYMTPEYAIYSAQQGGNTCTLPGGGTGFVVVTDANPTACYTPAQYGATFSGPQGGSPLAFQALHMQDYDARLTTSMGGHNIVVEGWKTRTTNTTIGTWRDSPTAISRPADASATTSSRSATRSGSAISPFTRCTSTGRTARPV